MKKNHVVWLLVIGYCLWFNVFTMVSNTEPLVSSLYAQTLNSGLEKYRQGNLEEAIIDFENVISKEDEKPKTKELASQYFVTCIIELSNRSKETQDYQKALTYLEKGINVFPDNIEIKNLYQETKEKQATVPQKPAVVPQPPAVPPQVPAVSPAVPAKKEATISPVTKEVAPTVPKAASQPSAVPPQAPAAVPQPPAVPPQAPAVPSKAPVMVTQPVPAAAKPVIPRKERKKESKEANTTKPVLTVTEVPLTPARKTEARKPAASGITEERLKLLEEKIIVLTENYEQERKELADKLAEKDKIIKRIIFCTVVIFLFLIFIFQRNIRNLVPGKIPKVLATAVEPAFLPTAKDTEKLFSDWLNTLENKEIVQIVTVLLNRPEENLRAKGFEFLEKIMKTKKFTADEQWKIERTIRKIGLEEGWVGK